MKIHSHETVTRQRLSTKNAVINYSFQTTHTVSKLESVSRVVHPIECPRTPKSASTTSNKRDSR